jgi:spore germination protein KA
MFPVGKANNNNCAVLYIDGITNPEIVNEVKRRINSIDTDFIETNGMLGQLIEDNPFNVFPDILYTERPDRTASFLMEEI